MLLITVILVPVTEFLNQPVTAQMDLSIPKKLTVLFVKTNAELVLKMLKTVLLVLNYTDQFQNVHSSHQ